MGSEMCIRDRSSAEWEKAYAQRVQHCFSRMNHHIHPLVDVDTGKRVLLSSCRKHDSAGRKKATEECKSGFPLDSQVTDEPVLVCECIAAQKGLPTRGPRSMLGDILPRRNSALLSAEPRALITFSGSNADLTFPMRLPNHVRNT